MRKAKTVESIQIGHYLIEVSYDGELMIHDTKNDEQICPNIHETIQISQFINASLAKVQRKNREELES